MQAAVGYLRVSTAEQGRSGLGWRHSATTLKRSERAKDS